MCHEQSVEGIGGGEEHRVQVAGQKSEFTET